MTSDPQRDRDDPALPEEWREAIAAAREDGPDGERKARLRAAIVAAAGSGAAASTAAAASAGGAAAGTGATSGTAATTGATGTAGGASAAGAGTGATIGAVTSGATGGLSLGSGVGLGTKVLIGAALTATGAVGGTYVATTQGAPEPTPAQDVGSARSGGTYVATTQGAPEPTPAQDVGSARSGPEPASDVRASGADPPDREGDAVPDREPASDPEADPEADDGEADKAGDRPSGDPLRGSPPPPRSQTAASELDLVRQAHRAVQDRPRRALALVDEHARRFPNGSFVQEREVVAIEALTKLGRWRAVRRRGERFLAAHPGSTHGARVERLMRLAPGAADRP